MKVRKPPTPEIRTLASLNADGSDKKVSAPRTSTSRAIQAPPRVDGGAQFRQSLSGLKSVNERDIAVGKVLRKELESYGIDPNNLQAVAHFYAEKLGVPDSFAVQLINDSQSLALEEDSNKRQGSLKDNEVLMGLTDRARDGRGLVSYEVPPEGWPGNLSAPGLGPSPLAGRPERPNSVIRLHEGMSEDQRLAVLLHEMDHVRGMSDVQRNPGTMRDPTHGSPLGGSEFQEEYAAQLAQQNPDYIP